MKDKSVQKASIDLLEKTTPLRVQFVITSLPVGGAEVLLLNLIQRMNREHFLPEVICLKEPGTMGEQFASEVPLHSDFLNSKWDLGVLPRLTSLLRKREADAVVTVGAGDKMFWGRLAAKLAGIPVICSALHSTGWPDGVGFLNRLLTPITSGFIACAQGHAQHLVDRERFPRERVFTIPNGVDTQRFRPNPILRGWLREQLGIPADSQTVGIVAALREEKNHLQFVRAGRETLRDHPNTHFVVVGDGPEREIIEAEIRRLDLQAHFHLLGNRRDTPAILAALDIFCLTSLNEANPVSILEAFACGLPVVSPDVGSIKESVLHGRTGLLTTPQSDTATADALKQLLDNPELARQMGNAGRHWVSQQWALDVMVCGYENLLSNLYNDWARKFVKPLFTRQFSSPVPELRLDEASLAPQLNPVAHQWTVEQCTAINSTHPNLRA